MHQIKIYPSLISSDLLNLEKTIRALEPHCDGFHLDVMDFHFVPNLTWGPPFINAIAAISKKPLFVHLMIERPAIILPRFNLRPGDYLSFHIESINNFHEIKNSVKEKKLKLSIALKPKTPISALFDYAKDVDHILLMSVEPGYSGQQFLPSALDRLKELKNYRDQNTLEFNIGMDGGINIDNMQELIQLGATDFGIAQGIFGQSNPIIALKTLYDVALC